MKNIRLQYSPWEDMSAEVQGLFVEWMDNDPQKGQSFYELYFYWYNIPHELGHILRGYYSSRGDTNWQEENAVNSFAVAYWKARGESTRLQKFGQLVRSAFSKLEDPVPSGEDRSSYLDEHYDELVPIPSAYGHFQFSMVLNALEEKQSFIQTLHSLITTQAIEATSPHSMPYPEITSDLPYQIVSDMRNYLAAYKVELPDIEVIREFSTNLQFVTWDD